MAKHESVIPSQTIKPTSQEASGPLLRTNGPPVHGIYVRAVGRDLITNIQRQFHRRPKSQRGEVNELAIAE
jgi:hypothetical protein